VSRFLEWREEKDVRPQDIRPALVSAYFEDLTNERAPHAVKQNLAAIQMFFDCLVTGQVAPFNQEQRVRGARYLIKKGKPPVLSIVEMRRLLDGIGTLSMLGSRNRASIGLTTYNFEFREWRDDITRSAYRRTRIPT